jgi:beta-phosphoglucomutase
MESLDAVFIDFDGTLVSSEHANACAYADALSALGFKLSFSEILDAVHGRHWSQFLPIILGSQYSDSLGKKIAEYKKIIYPNYFSEVRLNYGLIRLLRSIDSKVPIAIISNASLEAINKILDIFEIKDVFQLVVSFEHVKEPKPSPEGYLLGLSKLRAAASNSIAFEDSDVGLMAARAAKIPCLRVENFSFYE